MRRGITFTAIGLFAATSAAAECGSQIMACTFDNGAKTAEICLSDDLVTYTYGPTGGDPDLVIDTPIETVDYRPWSGVGASIWETIVVFNGETGYQMTAGFERDPDRDAGYGGISVQQNGSEINYLTCDPDSIDWSYGNLLAKAKRDRGLCWGGTPEEGWVACE